MVKLLGCDHANFPNFPDHPPSIEQGSPELRPELQLPSVDRPGAHCQTGDRLSPSRHGYTGTGAVPAFHRVG